MRTIYPKLITALFVVLLAAVLVHGSETALRDGKTIDKPTVSGPDITAGTNSQNNTHQPGYTATK